MANNLLPNATIREASGTPPRIVIDYIGPDGATVVIPAGAGLKADYVITVNVVGSNTTFEYKHTVQASEADKELSSIRYPREDLVAHKFENIELSYELLRPDGRSDKSGSMIYHVTAEP